MKEAPSTTHAGDGDRRRHLRSAEPDEAKDLEELPCRSASHWDYPEGYVDWAGDARKISESYVRENTVLVLVDSDGRRLGFYSLTEDVDGLLLDRMFLDIDQIGRGLGRVLWEYAVQTARELGVSEPTWTVQMYRFTLPR